MMAEPNAQSNPRKLDADMSNVHASMTPTVNGSSETYVDVEYLTPKSIAYAATVKSGDRALIVCTVLTGILEIAILDEIWPPTWKAAIGSVLRIIAGVGLRSLARRRTGLARSKQ